MKIKNLLAKALIIGSTFIFSSCSLAPFGNDAKREKYLQPLVTKLSDPNHTFNGVGGFTISGNFLEGNDHPINIGMNRKMFFSRCSFDINKKALTITAPSDRNNPNSKEIHQTIYEKNNKLYIFHISAQKTEEVPVSNVEKVKAQYRQLFYSEKEYFINSFLDTYKKDKEFDINKISKDGVKLKRDRDHSIDNATIRDKDKGIADIDLSELYKGVNDNIQHLVEHGLYLSIENNQVVNYLSRNTYYKHDVNDKNNFYYCYQSEITYAFITTPDFLFPDNL